MKRYSDVKKVSSIQMSAIHKVQDGENSILSAGGPGLQWLGTLGMES